MHDTRTRLKCQRRAERVYKLPWPVAATNCSAGFLRFKPPLHGCRRSEAKCSGMLDHDHPADSSSRN